MGIFKVFFVDIGDQQFIEDDLSIYSFCLENMCNFLECFDKDLLVLIDEFGLGIDLKIGGVIVEFIFRQFNEQWIYGVIMIYYFNLKIYVFKIKGIVNVFMNFNKDMFLLIYELQVGWLGSFYVFEIVEKSGLSNKILNYVKYCIGKNEKVVDQLFVELQQEKQEVEEKLVELIDKQKKLDVFIRNYEQFYKELEYCCKKVKLEVKEWVFQ